ncbi:MAG TPA: hypothetical protein VEC37_00925 [Bacillota bacterium]|nr:hypothetical protein [Bacillota bacterium]
MINRILLLMNVLFLVTTVCFASDDAFSTKASSRLIGKSKVIAISPDKRKVAVVEEATFKLKYHLVINGKAGKDYRLIIPQSIVFSPDSEKVAYFGLEKKKNFLVIDKDEVRIFDRAKEYPLFSPDSKRCGLMVKDGNQWSVFITGETESKTYRDVKNLKFSPDGSRFGYLAQRFDGRWVVVIDKVESPPYEMIYWFDFSPNGKRVAYCIKKDGKDTVVVDGKAEKSYDAVSTVDYKFSPDNSRFVYLAKKNNRWLVVNNQKESNPGDETVLESLGYSHRLLYTGIVGNKQMLVVDGEPQKLYDKVEFKSIIQTKERLIYCAVNNGEWVMVVNGKEIGKYDGIFSTVISKDGQHLAYKAQRGEKFLMVVDGVEHSIWDNVHNFIFSADGKNNAYIGVYNKKQVLVRNAREEKEFSNINGESLMFSPDGTYLVYEVNGFLGEGIYVNRRKCGTFVGVVSGFFFETNNRFRFISVQKTNYFWACIDNVITIKE